MEIEFEWDENSYELWLWFIQNGLFRARLSLIELSVQEKRQKRSSGIIGMLAKRMDYEKRV